ncbi:MAG: patatin family protein [Bacillota bacterium]|nr:patatin family protein [Bacillota bacterium]
MKNEKLGIVDVGGGFRGIYATGVLDYCMDNSIRFDLGIGVSAGSANLISYLAGQRGRNYVFYTEYGMRKEYASMKNFITKKSFIDLDYVYSTLSNSDGEYPLDYPAIAESSMEFIAVATDAETGDTKYFDKSNLKQDNYDILKASSALPFVCEPYPVNGRLYFDGALADSVPVKKAFELGCKKVVLLLTLPENTVRTPNRDKKIATLIRKKYPFSAEKMEHKYDNYNKGISLAKKLAGEGKVQIVAPDDTCGVNTLNRNPESLKKLYDKGYQDGIKISNFLENYTA